VERVADPADARSVSLALSKEGRALWKKIRAVDHRLLETLERRLSGKDVRAAALTLQRVRDALTASQEKDR
jgi:DNA-binding MarR family transcriptional regulator